MAKRKNQTSGKGVLDLHFDEGKATITTTTKDSEVVYDFFEILSEFNGKSISFSFSEDVEVEPLEEY